MHIGSEELVAASDPPGIWNEGPCITGKRGLFVDIHLEHHLDSVHLTRLARHSLPLLSVLFLLVVNIPERKSTDSTCS